MRRTLSVLVILGALLSLLAVAGPAAAAKPCGRLVIDDWYDDGRVDGTYPIHCYDDAIEILPRDVRDYSSAKDDIHRAMTAALRGDDPPASTNDPTPGQDPAVTTPGDDPPPTTPTTTTPPETTPPDPGPEVAPPVDGDKSASSVPIPLLVLAGLALLLVAGGSAGYLVRRFQGRGTPPPAV
ncbi:MAG TPA: hypothetical protein VIE18_06360 [Gaiellaceae bacterium]|jgi:hypothetical protein